MDTLVSICVGLGLAAACGFRVFLPLAVMSIATKAGMVSPSEHLAWVGTWPAVVAFSTACVAEVAGYYVPWVDHALDAVATPAAIVAGALVAARGLTAEGYLEFLRDQTQHWSQFAASVRTTESDLLIHTFFSAPRAGRDAFLEALSGFVPLIDRLGGSSALRELVRAIRDTADWWP